MALPRLRDVSAALFTGAAAIGLAATPMAAQAQQAQARPVAASQTDFPMSDARNIDANMVRIVAPQETGKHPSIALFGVSRDAWPTIRGAIQQAGANGFPVRAVFMGPTNAPPALEIYAKGTLVSNPINPNAINAATLTSLIERIHRREYPAALASRMSYDAPSQER